jgi:hypothetical protein
MTESVNGPREEPLIVVPKRVLQAIVTESQRHTATETGESLLGIVIPPRSQNYGEEPTFIILGTIPTGKATRAAAHFFLGGAFQVKVLTWLSQSWDVLRERSRPLPMYKTYQWGNTIPDSFIPKRFDLPLIPLGDWHKHPGGLTYPSEGDRRTAVRTLIDDTRKTSYLIAPISTVPYNRIEGFDWQEDLVSHERLDSPVNISFSYMSRQRILQGKKNFIKVRPHVVPDEIIPQLPALPWDLSDPERYAMEMHLLHDYGCTIDACYERTNSGSPLSVCFDISRSNSIHPWDHTVRIETSPLYPTVVPTVRILKDGAGQGKNIPISAERRQSGRPRWLQRLKGNTSLEYLPELVSEQNGNAFVWGSGRTLLNLIMYLERRGKLWVTSGNE